MESRFQPVQSEGSWGRSDFVPVGYDEIRQEYKMSDGRVWSRERVVHLYENLTHAMAPPDNNMGVVQFLATKAKELIA